MRCRISVPADQPENANGNGNPGLAIHKTCPPGYSQMVATACLPPAQRGGTGSCPRPPHGLQRPNRQIPSQVPRKNPWVSNAWRK